MTHRIPRPQHAADRNDRAFRFIRDYIGSHGFQPSYDAIADAAGIQKSRVREVLEQLEDRGLIVFTGDRVRGFVLADRGLELARAVRTLVVNFGADAVSGEFNRQTGSNG